MADFGLLKRITEMEGETKTRVAGTPGYVDPDYRRTNVVTTKSDVYWWGHAVAVILLTTWAWDTAFRIFIPPHVIHLIHPSALFLLVAMALYCSNCSVEERPQ